MWLQKRRFQRSSSRNQPNIIRFNEKLSKAKNPRISGKEKGLFATFDMKQSYIYCSLVWVSWCNTDTSCVWGIRCWSIVLLCQDFLHCPTAKFLHRMHIGGISVQETNVHNARCVLAESQNSSNCRSSLHRDINRLDQTRVSLSLLCVPKYHDHNRGLVWFYLKRDRTLSWIRRMVKLRCNPGKSF